VGDGFAGSLLSTHRSLHFHQIQVQVQVHHDQGFGSIGSTQYFRCLHAGCSMQVSKAAETMANEHRHSRFEPRVCKISSAEAQVTKIQILCATGHDTWTRHRHLQDLENGSERRRCCSLQHNRPPKGVKCPLTRVGEARLNDQLAPRNLEFRRISQSHTSQTGQVL